MEKLGNIVAMLLVGLCLISTAQSQDYEPAGGEGAPAKQAPADADKADASPDAEASGPAKAPPAGGPPRRRPAAALEYHHPVTDLLDRE